MFYVWNCIGQGSSHNRTITQKEQIAIMNDFRSGKCNVLIATCVAEEGIDVGEVDFIVCFDVNNKNPIRFIQRIGRTGRKRQGKVCLINDVYLFGKLLSRNTTDDFF